MYESTRRGLNQTNSGARSLEFENDPLEKPKDAYSEISDIFPALQKYKDDHNATNLQKLCAEISDFCRSVYASTRNEEERKIYKSMLQKLNT